MNKGKIIFMIKRFQSNSATKFNKISLIFKNYNGSAFWASWVSSEIIFLDKTPSRREISFFLEGFKLNRFRKKSKKNFSNFNVNLNLSLCICKYVLLVDDSLMYINIIQTNLEKKWHT